MKGNKLSGLSYEYIMKELEQINQGIHAIKVYMLNHERMIHDLDNRVTFLEQQVERLKKAVVVLRQQVNRD